jgi:hypothetical protein
MLVLLAAPGAIESGQVMTALACLAGVAGVILGVVSYRTTKEKDLRERIDSADLRLREELHDQEVKCATVSSEVLTRLNAIETHTKDCDRKLDYLIGWADNGGGRSRARD